MSADGFLVLFTRTTGPRPRHTIVDGPHSKADALAIFNASTALREIAAEGLGRLRVMREQDFQPQGPVKAEQLLIYPATPVTSP